MTEGQEDHYDLDSEVGNQRLQTADAHLVCENSQDQKGFINEKDSLKLNPCRKRKKMEIFCHESRDMGEPRNAGNHTSSRIKDK